MKSIFVWWGHQWLVMIGDLERIQLQKASAKWISEVLRNVLMRCSPLNAAAWCLLLSLSSPIFGKGGRPWLGTSGAPMVQPKVRKAWGVKAYGMGRRSSLWMYWSNCLVRFSVTHYWITHFNFWGWRSFAMFCPDGTSNYVGWEAVPRQASAIRAGAAARRRCCVARGGSWGGPGGALPAEQARYAVGWLHSWLPLANSH